MSPRKAAVALAFAPVAVALAAVPASATEHTKSGPRILTDAIAATTQATNFHVVGHSAISGSRTAVNLSLSPTEGGGTISENGATLQVVVVHKKTVYVKADEHSWRALTKDANTARELADKWIQFPASTKGLASFVKLTVPSQFVHLMLPGIVVGATTKKAMGRWDGRSAVVLHTGGGGQIYVADQGVPYLLHVQGSNSTATVYYNFTDFGDAPMPSVPVHFIKA